MAMAQLCFPPPTSFSLIESSKLYPLSLKPLSLSSPIRLKPTSLSLRQIQPVSCSSSSSSSASTLENPSSESTENEFIPTRLLAQNVPWTSTADEIRALFEKHGTVLQVELSMHNKIRNRGLAFVEMGSAEEAAEALAKLESYEFEGRSLKLNFAKPKKQKPSSPVEPRPAILYNLFVANLSFEARSKDLKEFFQSSGANVVSAEVIFHDNPRKSAGYGFVSFKTKKEADEALSTFEGKEMMGRPIRVARSKRFVKPETEMNSDVEGNQDSKRSET